MDTSSKASPTLEKFAIHIAMPRKTSINLGFFAYSRYDFTIDLLVFILITCIDLLYGLLSFNLLLVSMPSIDLDGSFSIQGKDVGASPVSSVESPEFSGEQRKAEPPNTW
ncbi:hypothetical protein L6452_19128 [Arctium lappa]|uniref:Uncharacterized protein n=1 Tax=Arctium lappa TaxID=4217 RepID=A0ACB9B7B1_ARCLA|nr:hypothetical protein L6452_19128 [Arctium lappa]